MREILSKLGYDESPNFLHGKRLENVTGYAHIFRRVCKDYRLQGVYMLRPEADGRISTPVLYVCEAQDDREALAIHRLVWNQNVVPFLLVKSPRHLRLYKGFSFTGANAEADTLISLRLEGLFMDVAKLCISSGDIDEGRIWEKWGKSIRPGDRVDIELLGQLRDLGKWLTGNGLDIQAAHALIGKYVYLRYLHDRKILSERKLKSWGFTSAQIFTRHATLEAFDGVNAELEEWLNGSVFPMPKASPRYRLKHIQTVAGIFFGDMLGGQLHLDFRAYDFSAIPTETLSIIYEQFLHAPTPDTTTSRGKRSAAHYTPLPLVNLTIDELGQRKALEVGMKVLDPSCGSGAFLVQCYRRLIEKERRSANKPTPNQLKQLLTDHIFGVELHEDACQVTALNLILTLLDNVTPPDLEVKRHQNFKLPILLNTNIFHGDFFDPGSTWAKKFVDYKFDWVVGNPPWKEVKKHPKEEEDVHARNWMHAPENRGHPATDNQLAEAFVWKVCDYLSDQGIAGLVLPAMSFTKQDSRFRKVFFAENRVHTVINLANLRKVLFHGAGRSASASGPAVVVCFQKGEPDADDTILTFAPFAIDQIPNRSLSKKTAWSMTINSSDLQELSARDVSDGSHLHWKVAMWGTPRDMRLMTKLQRTLESFISFRQEHGLNAHEGFQLRTLHSSEAVEHMPELEGRKAINFSILRGIGRIFRFPEKALNPIPESECYVRKGRGRIPTEVSRPPHVILDAARRFAVFSDEWLAVPPRQIGIAGGQENRDLLKALAAYLSSDFVRYWEFLISSEWGVKSARATLASLDTLPVPTALSDSRTTKKLAALNDELACSLEPDQAGLLGELNLLVFDALGLGESERILVEDTVIHKLKLLDGKVPKELVKEPDLETLQSYLEEFQRVLDGFVGESYSHEVNLQLTQKAAILQVRIHESGTPVEPRILSERSVEAQLADDLCTMCEQLRQEHSQWLYFDRCLKVYDGDCMYVLKPLQMSQWLRSKALRDADDVIGEYLAAEGQVN